MEHDPSSSARDPLERLAAEFLDRRRGGVPVSHSEYVEKYPQWAEQILEFFPALEVMEGLMPGSGEQTDSFTDRAEAAGTLRLELSAQVTRSWIEQRSVSPRVPRLVSGNSGWMAAPFRRWTWKLGPPKVD